jgi:hypothetical protein
MSCEGNLTKQKSCVRTLLFPTESTLKVERSNYNDDVTIYVTTGDDAP